MLDRNLDLLRAVAVLCVFGAHVYDQATGRHFEVTWHIGQMGVLMFFVHTALVLMQSLERTAAKKEGWALATEFYVRRAFRIYPLSVLCVTVAFLGWGPERATYSVGTYLSNVTLTTNLFRHEYMWPGLWTLPLEVQMYVALPILFVLLRHRPIALAFGLWALAVLAGILQPIVSARASVLAFGPCFLGGVIAWRLSAIVRPRIPAPWWPVALFALTPIWLIATREHREYYQWTFCLALGCAIPWFRSLSWKPLTSVALAIATYSYGIYLSHGIVIGWFLRPNETSVIRWVGFAFFAAFVPWLLYVSIESPLIDVGRRLAGRLATPARLTPQSPGPLGSPIVASESSPP